MKEEHHGQMTYDSLLLTVYADEMYDINKEEHLRTVAKRLENLSNGRGYTTESQ